MKLYAIFVLSILCVSFVPSGEAGTETQTHIRDYSVFEGFETGSGTKVFQFNATPFDLTGVVNTTHSSTYVKVHSSYLCEPTGINDCFITYSYTADIGFGTTGFYSHSNQVDSGQQDQYHTHDFISDVRTRNATFETINYLQGNTWINVTISDTNSNAISEDVTIQVWQREVYTIQVSTGNGGDIELNDHNVTVIEGDENRPIMRTYLWVVGFAIFFLLMAEWKRDMMHYIFAILALAYATLEFPDFLPQPLRIFPVALALYSGGLMMKEWRSMRQGRPE